MSCARASGLFTLVAILPSLLGRVVRGRSRVKVADQSADLRESLFVPLEERFAGIERLSKSRPCLLEIERAKPRVFASLNGCRMRPLLVESITHGFHLFPKPGNLVTDLVRPSLRTGNCSRAGRARRRRSRAGRSM